ncbi:MAG: helix-turn-helix domain-containing protein [Rhodoferax sp.]|nr:helix-turn-helix domain-containing protein [Rhodoferax sp.]
MPLELTQQVTLLGLRIRGARQARRLRLEDIADKTGLSRKTVEAVERGEPSTSLGAYVAVLGCMSLTQELDLIADPGLDREGLALRFSVAEKRVRRPQKVDNDF